MPELDLTFVVLVSGAFAAAFCAAAFSAGGALIVLAATSAVLPVSQIVPLHSTLLLGSLVARVYLFRHYVDLSIVRPFMLGSFVGAMVGSRIYVAIPTELIATFIATLMLIAIWLPEISWRPRMRHPWLAVGTIHSLLSTLFAYGALFHSVILHTSLSRREVIGTMAGCLLGMGVFKVSGYLLNGFDYSPYYWIIGGCTLVAPLGSLLGRRLVDRISERMFRMIFRTLVTVTALRLIWIGLIKG